MHSSSLRATLLLPFLCWQANFTTAIGQESLIPPDLITVAESSRYEATSTSEEVRLFLNACERQAGYVQTFEFGRTSQDRPLHGVIIADPPVTDGIRNDRLTVMLLGNIHSGECDGKEALLMLARDLALRRDHPWLKKLVIVMVPNYNADGNDQMSLTNRPGQIGPIRGMGTRETAQGFDLNRDFIKLETPEAQALVRLFAQWNPHVFIDCHTTNGSIHRYPLTFDIPHNPAVAEPLRQFLREQMMPGITAAMQKAGYETFYYGNFDRDHTRWESFGFEPRYSTEYAGLRGRIGILSESYSYADYQTRVLASREFVRQCIDATITHSDQIATLLREIEATPQPSDSGTTPMMPLNAAVGPFEKPVTVLGRVPDSNEPKDYEVEFWGRYSPTNEAPLPFAYVLPSASEAVLANLKNHGLQITALKESAQLEVRVHMVTSIQRKPTPFQKHHLVQLITDDRVEARTFPRGTFIVRTAQPLGRLAAWLLEPESCDGLATWNFFDDVIQEGVDFPVLSLPNPATLMTDTASN